MKNFETKFMQANCEVLLIRNDYSFENDDGKEIKGSKFILRIDGADVEFDVDKSAKGLLCKFIPYVPLQYVEEDD